MMTRSRPIIRAVRRRLWHEVTNGAEHQHTLGVLLLCVFLAIVFLDARRLGHLNNGDSNNLVEGARFALRCLEKGDLIGCGHLPGSVQTEVFPYPLLQYVPSGLLVGVGTSDGHVIVALGIISFIAFTASILFAVRTFRDRPRHGALIALALVGSSAVYHSTSAFGEGLVGSLVVIAVCAAVRGQPASIFLFVLLASLGKETIAPFVVALALISARSRADSLFPPRRLTIAAVTAGVSAMALNATFNVFRFGSVQNLLYLDPPLHTPGIVRKFEFLAGIMVSPSSGILWFWPFFSALAVVATAIGVHRLFSRMDEPHSYLPVLSVTGVMLLWFASLSAWFSPFGWIAYGPRLEVPLLGGLAVAYVHTAGEGIIGRVRHSRAAQLSGVALLLAGSLQFFAPWSHEQAIGQLITGRGSCPDMTGLDIYGDPGLFYRCVDHFMWRIRPSVFDDIVAAGMTWSTVGWLTGVAACLVLWRFIAVPTGKQTLDLVSITPRR